MLGPDDDSWYSDEALEKQREIDRRTKAGEKISLDLLCGWLEPRTQPTDAEKCTNCGSDARPEIGGEEHHGKRWCLLCVSRERHREDT